MFTITRAGETSDRHIVDGRLKAIAEILATHQKADINLEIDGQPLSVRKNPSNGDISLSSGSDSARVGNGARGGDLEPFKKMLSGAIEQLPAALPPVERNELSGLQELFADQKKATLDVSVGDRTYRVGKYESGPVYVKEAENEIRHNVRAAFANPAEPTIKGDVAQLLADLPAIKAQIAEVMPLAMPQVQETAPEIKSPRIVPEPQLSIDDLATDDSAPGISTEEFERLYSEAAGVPLEEFEELQQLRANLDNDTKYQQSIDELNSNDFVLDPLIELPNASSGYPLAFSSESIASIEEEQAQQITVDLPVEDVQLVEVESYRDEEIVYGYVNGSFIDGMDSDTAQSVLGLIESEVGTAVPGSANLQIIDDGKLLFAADENGVVTTNVYQTNPDILIDRQRTDLAQLKTFAQFKANKGTELKVTKGIDKPLEKITSAAPAQKAETKLNPALGNFFERAIKPGYDKLKPNARDLTIGDAKIKRYANLKGGGHSYKMVVDGQTAPIARTDKDGNVAPTQEYKSSPILQAKVGQLLEQAKAGALAIGPEPKAEKAAKPKSVAIAPESIKQAPPAIEKSQTKAQGLERT